MIKIENTAGNRARTRNASARKWQGRALRSALAVLALATLAATPASARPFQQYLNGVCSGTICKINFAKVPAGQRLLVNDVSCYVRLAPAAGGNFDLRAVQLLVLGANPNNVLSAVTLVPSLYAATSTEINYASNDTISAFANAQQRMQAYVEIVSGTFSQVACHISGDLART